MQWVYFVLFTALALPASWSLWFESASHFQRCVALTKSGHQGGVVYWFEEARVYAWLLSALAAGLAALLIF